MAGALGVVMQSGPLNVLPLDLYRYAVHSYYLDSV